MSDNTQVREFTGHLFRLRVGDWQRGCSTRLVTLFIEDDEVYHEKCSFDAVWISDLLTQLRAVQSAIGLEVKAEQRSWVRKAKAQLKEHNRAKRK